MSGTINTVANQPLAGPFETTDYFLVYQGSQSPPTRKLPASAVDELYAGLNGTNTFTAKQTISSGGLDVTGNTAITGTLSLSSALVVSAGGITVNTGGGVFENVGGWSSFNYGKQLLIRCTTGANNPALGITDTNGTNLWGVSNISGTLTFAKMPAYSNNTTPPDNVLSLTDALATISADLTVTGTFNKIRAGLSSVTSGAGQIIVGFSPTFSTLSGVWLTSFATSGNIIWEVTSASAGVGFNATARNTAGAAVNGVQAFWLAVGT